MGASADNGLRSARSQSSRASPMAACVSESWMKKKPSSCPPDLRRMFVHAPANPEAKTTPPKPSSLMSSRRPFGSFMSRPSGAMTGRVRRLFPRRQSALAAHQLDELLQLGFVPARHRPVVHAVLPPAGGVVAAPLDSLPRLVAAAPARRDDTVHQPLGAPVHNR